MNKTTKEKGANICYDQACEIHNPKLLSKGESAHNTGPTPTEYGDKWQPLRDKLSIRESQYLNTYTKSGDIAALNALVLGIISQRDRLREQLRLANIDAANMLPDCSKHPQDKNKGKTHTQ